MTPSIKAVASALMLFMSTTASAKEPAVQPPSDQDAIRNLASRYFDAVWRQDVDAYMDTFAPDGEFVLYGMQMGKISAPTSGEQSFSGHDAIRKAITAALPTSNALPLGHNQIVVIDSPTRAHGTLMMELLSAADFKMQTMVYYRDTYVKIAGHWKFQRREAHTMGPGMHP